MRERSNNSPAWSRALILTVAVAAGALLATTAQSAWAAASGDPLAFAAFAALAVVLQLLAGLYGKGSISVAGIGMLASGFVLGIGAAALTAVLAGAVHFARRRGNPVRAVFSAATLALASAAGSGIFQLFETPTSGSGARAALALAAGGLSWAINIGLLTLVMSLSEGRSALSIWRGRFRWLTVHYVAFGPLALAATLLFERVGAAGLLLFAVSPLLQTLSVRDYVERRRAALDLGLG